MGSYVVINSKKTPKNISLVHAPCYQTKRAGHAVEIIREIVLKDPDAVIHVYGGDGSVFEAANAVMGTPHADTVTLVIHPFGTGNDFVRNFSKEKQGIPFKIDLIRFNDGFSANEINIGFDCDVVAMTQKVKRCPLFRGGVAYLISVFLTLFKKMGRSFDFTVVDENDEIYTMKKDLLLCLATNGGYYGGGFHCAPLASLDDGLMEFLYVEKISRLKFLSFVLGYRKGRHLNSDGTVRSKYAPFLHYKRIKSITFQHIGDVCADGELFTFDSLALSITKQALTVQIEPKGES